MEKNKPARRDFIKLSAMALGGAAISPVVKASDFKPAGKEDKKLKIICVGAHPGDPEFGCGGTMAKYSDAGHKVTFLYLTPAAKPATPIKPITKWRHCAPRKAETACKILNAHSQIFGQIDGNTVLDKTQNDTIDQVNIIREARYRIYPVACGRASGPPSDGLAGINVMG